MIKAVEKRGTCAGPGAQGVSLLSGWALQTGPLKTVSLWRRALLLRIFCSIESRQVLSYLGVRRAAGSMPPIWAPQAARMSGATDGLSMFL